MDKPPLIALLVILLGIGNYIFSAPINSLEAGPSTLDDMFVSGLPLYDNHELMACLSKWESGHNNEAIGQAGEIGRWQFMPQTFQHFCVDEYGLEDNIYIQAECVDKMLENDLDFHWTTIKFCTG